MKARFSFQPLFAILAVSSVLTVPARATPVATPVATAFPATTDTQPSPQASPQESSPPVAPDRCPNLDGFWLANASEGVVTLRSGTDRSIAIRLRFYTGKNDFVASVPIEDLAATKQALGDYQWSVVRFATPEGLPILAVRIITASDVDHKACFRSSSDVLPGPGDDITVANMPDAKPITLAPAPGTLFDCPRPFNDAQVLDAVQPEFAGEAFGTSQVKVSIDRTGQVVGATVYRSSGSSVLDAATISAAKRSTYRAELVFCKPTAGSYLFTADFEPDTPEPTHKML